MPVVLVNRQKQFRLPRARMIRAVEAALGAKRWSITLCFVTPRESRSINKQFLSHDYAADVVSFDMSEGRERAGELMICPWVAARNAKTHGVSMTEELCRYAVHGTLHLLGYDDHKPADREKMWRKQEAIVSRVLKP